MTVLVTGGAGYIGSHTVRQLRAIGRDVVVLDSLELGRADSLFDTQLVVGDIADAELVRKICRDHEVDQVVHFAAYKNVGESMRDPAKYWRNNVSSAVELVQAVVEAGVRRFVFSSSCSVYGNPPRVPVSEDSPIRPESVYAQTKAIVEDLLRWYGATHQLHSVSLRYFNAAGASSDGVIGEDWTYSQNLIPVVMKAALGVSGPLEVYGDDYPTADGTCIRDYIHVEDLADAHVRALEFTGHTEGPASVAVNAGTGEGTSVLEVIRLTQECSGRTVPYRVVGRRQGDPVETYADVSTASSMLGWRASRSMREVIASAWAWHVKSLSSDSDHTS
ncbi:MAG: UDP-glucose 4-epimerase GalE [Actinomycetota bacterium]